MTDEEAKKVQKQFFIIAYGKFPDREFCEDIAQEAFIAYLLSENKSRSKQFFVIDAIRKQTNWSRHGQFSRDPMRHRLELDSAREIPDESYQRDCRAERDYSEVRRFSEKLRGTERLVADCVVDGMCNKEIARTLGVSEARVSQILSKICFRVSRGIFGDYIDGDDLYSILGWMGFDKAEEKIWLIQTLKL